MNDKVTPELIDGAELIVRTLERLRVSHAFSIPGLGMFPLVDAFYRHRDSIRYITALNETNLTLIANGYARATRQPAFVDVYHASGTGLAMMAVTTAWADSVPLVLCSTTTRRSLGGRDQYAGVPRAVTEMSEQFVKWSAEVPSADRIPEIIERAFTIAATPPFGPVHIAVPMDLLTDLTEDTPLGAQQPVQLFAATAPDPGGVRQVVEILDAAERPVLVMGSEVARYQAVEDAVRLAERLGCPVLIEPYPSDLGFPTAHPQYVGRLAHNADVVAEADACVLVGVDIAPLADRDLPRFRVDAGVVSISVDPDLALRQFRPTVSLLSAPAPALTAIAGAVKAVPAQRIAARQEWVDRLAGRLRESREALRPTVAADEGTIPLWDVIDAVETCMPSDFILVNHAGTAEYQFQSVVTLAKPERYFGVSGRASAQGTGGPNAIGVQLARPDTRVLAALGDGGLLFTGTTLYTASRFKIPVIFLIMNNEGWGSIETSMRHSGLKGSVAEDEFGFAFNDPTVDLVMFARSQGLQARRVTQRADLEAALREAAISDEPWLIDVAISRKEGDAFMRAMGVGN